MTSNECCPLDDGQSYLALVDSMGNSLSVVNDARQSFDKESTEWADQDGKLLRYLADHHHTSPFRGVVFKWRVKAPLFVARQWWKHTVASSYVDDQLGWNEKSFRYCSAEDAQFYMPKQFLAQAKSNRQASGEALPSGTQQSAKLEWSRALGAATAAYAELLLMGVSKEQARAVLPAALYTSFTWTCSLHALLHFISLRKQDGAQGEIIAYANALIELGSPVAPEAFEAFAANNYQF